MKNLLLAPLALLTLIGAVQAQSYVPTHAIPVGRGAGVSGFNSIGPCASGMPVVSAGGSSDPVCLSTQSANTVFAGPNTGSPANPTWRALVSADIPSSVALAGTPTAPTPSPGDNSTKIATTAFVGTAIGSSVTSAGNNVFTGTNQFQNGISVGTSAPAPATADVYGYSASRSVVYQGKRDAVLARGDVISEFEWWGKNASSTSLQWAEIFSGPAYCRGKPSFNGYPCATTVTGAGGEEGAIYLSRTDGGNVVTATTNATTAIGDPTLHFASPFLDKGWLVGMVVTDVTTPSAIPAGTRVAQMTQTTVVMSNNAAVGVGNGDTINFSSPDVDWFDSNGLTIAGLRNIQIPPGQGIVSFDNSGTATYMMSYNSHAGMSLDFQSCNNVGITCSGLGANPAIRFYTSAAGAGQPALQINYDNTIVVNALSGSGSAGSHAVCMDSSNRLFKASGTTCP